jgi:hypothetical protein
MIRTVPAFVLLVACGLTASAQPKPKDGKEPPKPHRDAPLKSKDEAKFFSEAAFKRVRPAAEKLLKEKGIDLLVEAYTVAPKMDAAKLKAMTPEEREKVFMEFARERTKAEKINGVYIVVNKNPGYVRVELAGPAASTFPAGFGSLLAKTLIYEFKDKKFDGGLEEAVEMILQEQGLAPKKKDEKKEEKK